MNKKILIAVLVASVILGNNSIFVNAYPYTQKFQEHYGTISLANAMSPSRYSDFSNNYIRVTSKCNMPRGLGTSPHIGVDMTMSAGTKVFPIFPGRITSINRDLSAQLGHVIINSDINNDGSPDGIYIKYLHIAPYSSSVITTDINNPNSWLTINKDFALIDIQRPDGYSPHLHFGWFDSTSVKMQKMFRLYRHVPTYQYGTDFVYKYDFSNIPGVEYGSLVNFYLVGYRNATGYDNWGVWPQFYEHPPVKPSQYATFGSGGTPMPIISKSKSIETDDYGNSISDASTIQLSSKVLGEIEYQGDLDYFNFTTNTSYYFCVKHSSSSGVGAYNTG